MGARSLAWDCVQLGECRPAHRSRKDRARWCRGRTGVPHAWTWRDDRTLPNIGHQLRDFIYVTDVAQAVLLAVQNQPRGVINVGSGVPTAVGHVADHLADLLDGPRATPTGTKRSGDSRHCWGDISRARQMMNFVPTVTLLEGLTQTVTWAEQSRT